ncbi:MAG: molybdopterin-dependent oxidoreductase [Acidimicrobiales bacterium]|nr:molybdopterin-dependent oxidoreductase [Acidimicrobiales bacterium]
MALAVLLCAALVTGLLAFATGNGWALWVVGAHGVAGLAIVLIIPWKSTVVRRGMGRSRPGRGASVLLAAMTFVALTSGFMFSTGLVLRYGPLNAMQVHVGSAVVAIAVALVHVWQRPVRPRAVDLERRNLLRAGALAGTAIAAYAGLEGAMRLLRLPGERRRDTGSHERGSFDPAAMPVVSWFDDKIPNVDGWLLTVKAGGGLRTWTIAELGEFADHVTATLDCTSGWYATQEWTGVRIDRLLGTLAGESILVTSATGYRRRYPIGDAPRLLLATGVGGNPLSPGHGAPARLVAPGRRGFWWVKWVTEISVEERPWWVQAPFPLT